MAVVSVRSKIFKMLTDNRTGVKPTTAIAVADLASYMAGQSQLGVADRERWEKLNVLDKDGMVHMDDPSEGLSWIMLALLWDGIVVKEVAKTN